MANWDRLQNISNVANWDIKFIDNSWSTGR